MVKPLFIIGNPRSGTSVFRLILTCHSQIEIPPESGFMLWWQEKYANWKALDNLENLDQFIEDLFTSKKIEFWNLDKLLLKNHIIKSNPNSYSDLIKVIYSYYASYRGKSNIKYWGDKNNYYIKSVDKLHQLYPDANFVHIIRDGRDVACSYKKLHNINSNSLYAPKLPIKVEEIAREWVENNSLALSSFNIIDAEQKYFIRYEDIVNQPEKELSKLCSFLDIPYESAMLEYYKINQVEKLEPDDFLDWKAKTHKRLDSKDIGKFKNELTKDEIRIFEDLAFNMLESFGYLN